MSVGLVIGICAALIASPVVCKAQQTFFNNVAAGCVNERASLVSINENRQDFEAALANLHDGAFRELIAQSKLDRQGGYFVSTADRSVFVLPISERTLRASRLAKADAGVVLSSVVFTEFRDHGVDRTVAFIVKVIRSYGRSPVVKIVDQDGTIEVLINSSDLAKSSIVRHAKPNAFLASNSNNSFSDCLLQYIGWSGWQDVLQSLGSVCGLSATGLAVAGIVKDYVGCATGGVADCVWAHLETTQFLACAPVEVLACMQ